MGESAKLLMGVGRQGRSTRCFFLTWSPHRQVTSGFTGLPVEVEASGGDYWSGDGGGVLVHWFCLPRLTLLRWVLPEGEYL